MGHGAYPIANPSSARNATDDKNSVQLVELEPRRAAGVIAEIQRRSDDWFRAGLYATSSLEAEKCRTAAAVLAQLANDLRVA